MKKNSVENIVIKIIISAGILNSVIQFFYNRSIWLDEAMLALNIIKKSNLALLSPLDYYQVSPILFLQLEKITSLLIPDSEYGLRIIPLLAFFLSVFFMYKITDMLFVNKYGVIFAMSLFVFNQTVIYYSSEVKQYMTDVASVLCIYYFILKYYNKDKNKYYILGILGMVIVLLSNVAPIILFSCGLYMIYEYFRDKNIDFKYTAFIFAAWAGTFLIYFYFFIFGHPSRDIMIVYWSGANAFLPQNPFKTEFYIFLHNKMMNIFNSLSPLGVPGAIGLIVLFFTGIVNMLRSNKLNIIILTMTPLIIHLLLSGFILYPFDLRLILYTIPSIIIICSYGFSYLSDVSFRYLKIEHSKILAAVIPVVFLVSFYTTSKGFPIKHDEIKESISYIQENSSPSDRIYVYWRGSYAFKYYRNIDFVNDKIPVVFGSIFRDPDEKEKFIDEIKALKGKLWLLFSYVQNNDEKYITGKLDSLGYKRLGEFKTTGSSSYQYDIGE